MYLVINLRGEETFSSTTPPLTMYSLIHLDPWWCIRQYMLTPDNVICIEFLTCEKSNTQFFFHKTVEKMFPHNRKPNNQDIILIYGMFYWSQYCKDYDNFSKVKCCYFLVTFLRKRPKIHKNGNDIGLSLLCECDIEIIAAQHNTSTRLIGAATAKDAWLILFWFLRQFYVIERQIAAASTFFKYFSIIWKPSQAS